jgi:hypothetical protein
MCDGRFSPGGESFLSSSRPFHEPDLNTPYPSRAVCEVGRLTFLIQKDCGIERRTAPPYRFAV